MKKLILPILVSVAIAFVFSFVVSAHFFTNSNPIAASKERGWLPSSGAHILL